MEYVKLGGSGLHVSKLCFGSLTLSGLQSGVAPEEGAEVMAYAFSRGVNFIDTAQYYGNYETIKLALANNGAVAVSSKTYAYTAETAESAVDEARRKLDRDVIDVFMLHEQESVHTLRGHAAALDYLFTAAAKGKIRAVGVSTHHIAGVFGVCELKRRGYPITVIHPIINKLGLGIADGTTQAMLAAIQTAHDMGIGVMAMKVLAGGHLYADAGAAFDFALDNPAVDCAAVGMQTFDEVDANVSYFATRKYDKPYTGGSRRLFIERYCEGCGKCVTRCPQKALTVRDGHAVPDASCILCGYCAPVCPVFAIKIL
jgi:aryl-alcohol dehydrogenase-like predicted oxidoreductase/Pyruvate/2-oxoacid:ferredoxin oxidoreductase delta subunit